MKGRLIATAATVAAAVALSSGVFALPAAAASSTVMTAVFDATGNAAWGTSPEVTGASAYDTATVVGDGTLTPTGTVTYSFFDNGSCTSDSNTTTDTETLNVDGSVPISTPTVALGAGNYSYDATYSGDGDNDPSPASTCELFTVNQTSSSVTTSVMNASTSTPWSNVSATTGARAFDTATVTGTVDGFPPSGTVTYTLYPGSTCSGTPLSTPQMVTLSGGAVPNSATTAPLGVGTYSFDAAYSGDGNYSPPAADSCEPFSVGKAPSSVTTSVLNASTSAPWSNGSATIGATAYDTATVTGTVDGFAPSGTVTYTLYPGATCSGTPLSSPQMVTLSGGAVPYSATTAPLGAGTYSFDVAYSGDGNYSPPAADSCEPFTVNQAPSSVTTSVLNASTSTPWSNGSATTGATAFDTATVTGTVEGFAPSGTVTYTLYPGATCSGTPLSTPQMVTLSGGAVPNSGTTAPLGAGTYSFDVAYSGDGNYSPPAADSCEPFTVNQAPSSVTTTVFDAVTNVEWTGTEVTQASAYDTSTVTGVAGITPSGTVTYTYFTNGMCTGSGSPAGTETLAAGLVSNSSTQGPLDPGIYSFEAAYSGDANYDGSAISACEPFTVAQGSASAPFIANIPVSATYGGSFAAAVSTTGDGRKSVTSSTPGYCTVGSDGLTITYVGAGPCIVKAHVAGTLEYAGNSGQNQSFSIGRGTPSSPVVANIPGAATEFGTFTAAVLTNGDGTGSIASSTGGVCTVGSDGLTVSFVGFGSCTLTASVGQGANYFGRTGPPQTFTVNPAARGYWLVGSDGGIFSFGAAGFHGSMGGIPLQRPVVGITPTATRNGYWLVASDGGIFAFGDSSYYGSVPGVGLHPAGSGQPNSLDAPIVGMVPSHDGGGYFMVASDGGVFAFGDARFAGSCPGIGGCYGAAVAVMPDSTGNGYWLVTNLGAVYAFGDAGNYGEPPTQSGPAVDAVATPDGHGYWVLYANGAVFGFGDAAGSGAPVGYVNSFNPAAAIFPTADGRGYWVAAARGDVFCYGDAPFMGSMAATGLNGKIIAGFGF